MPNSFDRMMAFIRTFPLSRRLIIYKKLTEHVIASDEDYMEKMVKYPNEQLEIFGKYFMPDGGVRSVTVGRLIILRGLIDYIIKQGARGDALEHEEYFPGIPLSREKLRAHQNFYRDCRKSLRSWDYLMEHFLSDEQIHRDGVQALRDWKQRRDEADLAQLRKTGIKMGQFTLPATF